MSNRIPLIKLDFPEIVIIDIIGDGNCLFHAILQSVHKYYNELKTDQKMTEVKEFKKYLSKVLELEVNGKIVYDKLSRGNLREFGKAIPEFNLENMKQELLSNNWIDNRYNELISNTLNIDLYIIDEKTEDIYISGNDLDILYFNRNSIVVLYTGNHYDLIGWQYNNNINTIFSSEHQFIKAIRKRLDILLNIK